MPQNDFNLTIEAGSAFLILPPPDLARIPLHGGKPVVSAGDTLAVGDAVGEPCDPLGPWTHTPVAGEVLEVAGGCVTVRSAPGPGPEAQAAIPDFSVLGREQIAETLSRLGADVSRLRPARRLIVNACPPEPGLSVTGRLLKDYRDTLSRGLKLAKALVSPTTVTVAGPDADASAFGNCEVVRVRPRYPLNLTPLVIKEVTGREDDAGVTVVDLFQLLTLGRIQETGRPVTDVFLTAQGRNVQAKVGTPLREVLASVDARPADGDRVIVGGPLRGEALCDLNQGLARCDYGLFLIPEGSYPPVRDAACLNCGECVRRCPARIFPGELSMCAEARLFERARAGHVETCFECGICGYVCPARRPLLQYIRFAKSELRLMDAALRAPEEEPVAAEPPKENEGVR